MESNPVMWTALASTLAAGVAAAYCIASGQTPHNRAFLSLRGRCGRCGYPMQFLPSVRCPECGHRDPDAWSAAHS